MVRCGPLNRGRGGDTGCGAPDFCSPVPAVRVNLSLAGSSLMLTFLCVPKSRSSCACSMDDWEGEGVREVGMSPDTTGHQGISKVYPPSSPVDQSGSGSGALRDQRDPIASYVDQCLRRGLSRLIVTLLSDYDGTSTTTEWLVRQ